MSTPLIRRAWLRPAAWLLLIAALHGPRLDGPLTDGQHGNCAGMFGLFARNAQVLGDIACWVPVINPVPPVALESAEFYTHHPPLLPWLNLVAMSVTGTDYTVASRLVALLLSWWAACLIAGLVQRVAGRGAGWLAGLTLLCLPAGLHHGALVNYETVAVPAALWLLTVLTTRGSAAVATLAGALAALADWIALFPLVWSWRGAAPARRRQALIGAVAGLGACSLLFRSVAAGSLTATLAQAWAVSPLAADFSTASWAAAQWQHLTALYGAALVPAVLGVAWACVPAAARAAGLSDEARRLLRTLFAFGAVNLVAFARHATGHEHYVLLLAPFVASSTALALVVVHRAAGSRVGVALAALIALLLAFESAQRFETQRDAREQTHQWTQATRFAQLADLDHVYVRPEGVSFVFLYAAGRQVVPFPASSLPRARQLAADHRRRFGLPPGRTFWVTFPGDALPAWLAGRTALAEQDGFRIGSLDRPQGDEPLGDEPPEDG